MDRDGRYITDLRKEDFQIYEDGIEQEVAWVAPVEQPFTILFLLDTSGSMGYRLQDLAAAANAFVRQLRLNDRLISATFNDTVQVQWEATAVKEVLDSKRFRLRGGGNTLLYDAVDYALKRMKKVEGRKAIVLFSDGYGSGVFASEKSTLRKAEEQDALIYTVQFDTAPKEPPRNVNKKYFYDAVERADRYMRDLAQKTGGRPYQVDTLSDLGQAFGLIADELRRQYSLGYYPKKPLETGQRHEIKVRVRLPNLVVRARDSYTVDKAVAKRK
jgi:Ca-activated chloride channel family protein